MTQKQGFAISGTHAPARATPLSLLHADRNQRFLKGLDRESFLLSPGLHHTAGSQQLESVIVKKLYKHRPPLKNSSSVSRCACFAVIEPSKWQSVGVVDPRLEGDIGEAIPVVEETECPRPSRL